MKHVSAISLLALALILTGCASLFSDPLQSAYESGQISKEEYETRRLERDEAMARKAPAHWQLQQSLSECHSKLAHE